MSQSIVVPTLDPNYDLAVLNPLQQALLPYEIWWELFLWTLFAAILSWKFYVYIIKPYLK